jgi:3-methyladenine DNA glycosylase Mpg
MDYVDKIEELERSNNRFAPIILAQLAANRSEDPEAKLVTKIALTRSLYKRGFAREDVISLYRFIDWVLNLPKELEIVYNQQLMAIEEELKVEYVTTAERIGIEKGLAQAQEYITTAERMGIEKGLAQAQEYITTAERMGIEKGLAQAQEHITTAERMGIQKGESVVILRLLERKFSLVPEAYREKIQTANADILLEWADRVLSSQSIEEVFA